MRARPIAASRATFFLTQQRRATRLHLSVALQHRRRMMAADRVAVIGAGPVGLYAAFRLVQAGHRVVVWEKGSIASNVEQWGHVTFF